MYPYMGLKELLWMLSGRTDIKWLNDRGVTYWDEWVLDDGTIGKSYGY
nr:MAG TPA: Thymidylate synthase [Caudoviricetes sp.]